MAGWIRNRHPNGRGVKSGEIAPRSERSERSEHVETVPAALRWEACEPDRPGRTGLGWSGDGRARLAQADQVMATADEIEHSFTGSVISARKTTDAFLDLWGAAHELDPSVARPAERLLVALVGRNFATHAELKSALDRTRVEVKACLECDDLFGELADGPVILRR